MASFSSQLPVPVHLVRPSQQGSFKQQELEASRDSAVKNREHERMRTFAHSLSPPCTVPTPTTGNDTNQS